MGGLVVASRFFSAFRTSCAEAYGFIPDIAAQLPR